MIGNKSANIRTKIMYMRVILQREKMDSALNPQSLSSVTLFICSIYCK